MKTLLHGRNLLRTGAIAAAILALTAAVRAASDIPADITLDNQSTKESWISLSAGGLDLEGSSSAYQQMRQHEDSGFGGVDAFRYKKYLEGDRVLKIDGKAIFGDNEYRLRLRLEDEANGWFFGAGFRESRVFYDGSGGYSPGGLWIQPFDDQIFIDRGEFWLEGGIKKEAWTLNIRGSHSYRKGIKDSTQWADSIFSGLGNNARSTVPAWLGIDEERNTLALDLDFERDATEAGVGVRIESLETENSRNILRNPGQANPTGNGQRFLVTHEGTDADLFASHAYMQRKYGEKLTLSGAASMTSLDTILSGDRIYGSSYDAGYVPTFPRTSTGHGYIDLEGETQWDQWVMVGNAIYAPAKGWTINGGIRYENQSQDSIAEYIETAGPANNPFEEEFENEGEREFDEFLATIEANYTGAADFVVTPFAEYATGEGTLIEEQFEGPTLSTVVIDRDTEYERDYAKYGVNARWYPSTTFNAATGFYRKERNNGYTTVADNTPPTGGNRYPAFIADQDFTTDDLYIRATVRPLSSFSVTARWDRQQSEIESTEQGLAGVISSEQDVDILSATLSWTIIPRLLVQAGANMVTDGVVTGTVSANSPTAGLVGAFDSDYKTYNAMLLFALAEDSDLQVDYYRFSSDNYEGSPAITLPYGLTARDQITGVTYTRKLSADLQFSMRYVYTKFSELNSGGFRDFKGHMVYGRMQMRF